MLQCYNVKMLQCYTSFYFIQAPAKIQGPFAILRRIKRTLFIRKKKPIGNSIICKKKHNLRIFFSYQYGNQEKVYSMSFFNIPSRFGIYLRELDPSSRGDVSGISALIGINLMHLFTLQCHHGARYSQRHLFTFLFAKLLID